MAYTGLSDTRRLALAATFLLLAATTVRADFNGPAPNPLPAGMGGTGARNGDASGAFFFAVQYGACAWSAAGDVGPCVNAAVAAAAAAGGGTVVIPAGTYGLATEITVSTSGVHLLGAGVGDPRDNIANASFQSITRLVWNGVAGGTMIDVEPAGSESLYSNDAIGIVADGASLASVGWRIAQVSHSTFMIGGAETRSINVLFTTDVMADAPGTQDNDVWVTSRSTSPTYSPTGVMFDSGPGSNWNFSYNRLHKVNAWFNNGDGVVFGNSDNNIADDISTMRNPGGTGTPVVFASSGYTSPNGVAVNGIAYTTSVRHVGTPILVAGFQNGSALTKNSGNSCNGGGASACGPTTTSLTTNGATGIFGATLNFAAVSGVATGESVTCGGSSAGGLLPHTAVSGVGSTTVSLQWPANYAIPSGTSCAFGYGVTPRAASGTYVITAASATTFNITAPSGGHAQTGVAISGGVISFTDVVVPFGGTPTAGDSWTLVVPTPPFEISFSGVDNANAITNPQFDFGATGAYARSNQIYPTLVSALGASQGGLAIGNGVATGQGAIALGGGVPYATNFASAAWNAGTTASGYASTAFGHNATAAGVYSVAMGENVLAAGSMSRVGGEAGSDRGHYGSDAWGCPAFYVQGDCQTRRLLLRGTGAGASAIRLTADGAAAGSTNCVNLPANSAFSLTISVIAFDHTTPGKNETWQNLGLLITQGASASTTAVASVSSATLASNGVVSGSSISAVADTVNGCLNLGFTPPTSNTDTWDIVARVESLEAQ